MILSLAGKTLLKSSNALVGAALELGFAILYFSVSKMLCALTSLHRQRWLSGSQQKKRDTGPWRSMPPFKQKLRNVRQHLMSWSCSWLCEAQGWTVLSFFFFFDVLLLVECSLLHKPIC